MYTDADCCNDTLLLEDLRMPEHLRQCFNIDTENDLSFTRKCLPFTRSDAICTKKEERDQFNGISSFIDGSMIYGSDKDTAEKLKSTTGGTLKTHVIGDVLPTRAQCEFESIHGQDPKDLVAGDIRAIEQPGLASMHSLFLNEHNRLAG